MFPSHKRPGNLSPYYITSAPDSPTSPSIGRSASQYSKNKPHRPLAAWNVTQPLHLTSNLERLGDVVQPHQLPHQEAPNRHTAVRIITDEKLNYQQRRRFYFGKNQLFIHY
ncbi:hypothetical protein WR25_13202 [Diploscapter pachys]|uniref:Uncharacterized protein n=1 Tax=Diploscapter pachys TaxID=2018661 RepID=A0A2A2KY75_9BILA|nr:hypothetical protein WR25_13202 [Diploscapter pachys]